MTKERENRPQAYDYSEFEDDRRYRGRILTAEQRRELKRVSDQIASKFGVKTEDSFTKLLG